MLFINYAHEIDSFRWICLEYVIWYLFHFANHFTSLRRNKVKQENWIYFLKAWASSRLKRLKIKSSISFMHQSSEAAWLKWILFCCNRLWLNLLPVNQGNIFSKEYKYKKWIYNLLVYTISIILSCFTFSDVEQYEFGKNENLFDIFHLPFVLPWYQLWSNKRKRFGFKQSQLHQRNCRT